MGRRDGRGLAAILAWAALTVGGGTRLAAAPTGPLLAPLPLATGPLWPFKRLFHADYVDLRSVASRYGLTPEWTVRGRVMTLVDREHQVRLKFENQDRDFFLDGVRVFLGSPVVAFRDSLYAGKIDVIKTLEPLLDPADAAGRPRVPHVIAVDAGHGGRDDGTSNRQLGLLEKNATLDTALRLEKLLDARGYQVVMTRTTDRYVPLDRRTEIATRAHADLFVSIHFNSLVDDPRVTGTEVYAMTPRFQPSTQPERDKSMISTWYPGNRNDPWNIVLGYRMQRRVLARLGTADRGLKRARYVVLRMVDCPAVLVESAYLSNDAEARRVGSPAFRQRVAEAIAGGIDDYATLIASLGHRSRTAGGAGVRTP